MALNLVKSRSARILTHPEGALPSHSSKQGPNLLEEAREGSGSGGLVVGTLHMKSEGRPVLAVRLDATAATTSGMIADSRPTPERSAFLHLLALGSSASVVTRVWTPDLPRILERKYSFSDDGRTGNKDAVPATTCE
jgi:hypothetical protein